MKPNHVITLLLLLFAKVVLAQPNFVNDPLNAEMLLITHEALLTDEWEPGMNGAWETKFLALKASQGIDVYLHAIGDDVSHTTIKSWIEENCEALQYLLVIGDTKRRYNMRPHMPGSPAFNPASVTEDFWRVSDSDSGVFVPMYGELIELDIYYFGEVPIWNDTKYVEEFIGCKVGRIPASSNAQIVNYMNKAYDYSQLNNPAWMSSLLFLQNDKYYGRGYNNPWYLKNALEPQYLKTLNGNVFETIYRYTDAPGKEGISERYNEVKDLIELGTGVITARGTGSLSGNFFEMLYDTLDLVFDNEGMYPFVIGSCCDVGAFDYVDEENEDVPNVLEEMLLSANSGIIGAIAPTWWTTPIHCDLLVTEANRYIYQNSIFEFGQLHLNSLDKIKAVCSEMRGLGLVDYFILFGDPSLKLPYRHFGVGAWEDFIDLGGSVLIGDGDTLRIRAGTDVVFPQGGSLIIEPGGTLIVEGTEEDPVTFSKSGGSDLFPAISGEEGSLFVSYTEFNDFDTAIELTDCEGLIENCTIEDAGYDAIYIMNCTSALEFVDNTITGANANALYSYNSSAKFTGNSFVSNNGGSLKTALYLYNSSLTLLSNDIRNNQYAGIKATGGGALSMSNFSDTNKAKNRVKNNNRYTHTAKVDSTWAEIIQVSPSYIYLDQGHNDIISEDGDYLFANHGFVSPFYYYATKNYWESSTTVSSSDFYPTGSVDFSSADLMENYTSSAEDEITAFFAFKNASIALDSGNVQTGLSDLQYIVSEYPNTKIAISASRRVYDVLREGSDKYQLLSTLNSWSESENEGLSAYADRLKHLTLVDMRQLENAVNSYEEVLTELESGRDSLYWAIDYLYAKLIQERQIARENENQVNSLGNRNPRITQIKNEIAMLNARLNGSDWATGELAGIPTNHDLIAAFPNPFNNTVAIRFSIANSERVMLKIYDVQGRVVAVLQDGVMHIGYHQISWQATDLATGVYFCRLEVAGFKKTMKLTLIK